MLKVTSEESISKDCQEVCVNQKPELGICLNLYVAIQKSTPKLGENGHGLPPKITNEEKPEDYESLDDENDGEIFGFYKIKWIQYIIVCFFFNIIEDLGAQHSDEEQISKAIGAAAAVDDTILENPKQPSIDKQPSKSKMIF